MNFSPRLGLSYLSASQSQKHVTVNEALRRLDAIVQLNVVSATTGAQPGMPSDGDCYILPAGKTGADWGSMTNYSIAYYVDGAWSQLTPKEGWRAWVADTDQALVFNGATWGAPARLGVNATPDATNRLAVKSNAALFSHDDVTPGTGDMRVVVNKSAAAKTASLLFEDADSGRVEFGLIGDDDLHLRVSADGAAWKEPLSFSRTTGLATFHAIGASSIEVKTTSDSYNPVIAYVDMSPGQTRIGAFNFLDDTGGVVGQFAYFFNKASPADQALRIFVNGGEHFRVTGGGHVGIGTTAPAVKLDVDGPVKVKSYAKASLPAASAGAGQMIYVTDEAGGAVIAFSDGTDWRRVTDRAVVS